MKIDGSIYRWEGIKMEDRRAFRPEVKDSKGHFVIEVAEFNSDLLIIGTKI